MFFEISDEDTSKYFVDKAIWKCGEEYRSHQGKYPVIFLTFKDVKFDNWNDTIGKISGLLQEEYGRHQELMNSDKISEYEKEYFKTILNSRANEVELSSSLERLSKMLATHYEKAPVIIIDEYDTPIQEGYSKNFYDNIIGFMRNFFSGAFKDNKNLSYGFLTGIVRIAQESIFSRCFCIYKTLGQIGPRLTLRERRRSREKGISYCSGSCIIRCRIVLSSILIVCISIQMMKEYSQLFKKRFSIR